MAGRFPFLMITFVPLEKGGFTTIVRVDFQRTSELRNREEEMDARQGRLLLVRDDTAQRQPCAPMPVPARSGRCSGKLESEDTSSTRVTRYFEVNVPKARSSKSEASIACSERVTC
jgi:hypothetical protein